jgi:hypothetical protein
MVKNRLMDDVEIVESLGGRVVGRWAVHTAVKGFEFPRLRNASLSQKNESRSGTGESVAFGFCGGNEGAVLQFTGVHGVGMHGRPQIR